MPGRYSTAQAVIEETALRRFPAKPSYRAALLPTCPGRNAARSAALQHPGPRFLSSKTETGSRVMAQRLRFARAALRPGHGVATAAQSPNSFFALPPQIAAVAAASNPVDTTCSIGSKSAMSNG